MNKHAFHSSIKFIEIEDLKANRFAFVKNETLRENICIKMQYILFLISIEEEYELPGPISYSTFKTIILFTGSIIEALIHYKLNELIKFGLIHEKDFMGVDEKFSLIKKPYKISENEEIFGIKKTTKQKKFSKNIDFQSLNRIAKKSQLFTKNIFDKAEKLRETRNKIHLYSMQEVDDKYTKKDIIEIFSTARIIIERIESFPN